MYVNRTVCMLRPIALYGSNTRYVPVAILESPNPDNRTFRTNPAILRSQYKHRGQEESYEREDPGKVNAAAVGLHERWEQPPR